VLNAYAVSIDSSFMQRSNFTKWQIGKRDTPLQPVSVHVLRQFCNMYNPLDQEEKSSDDDGEGH
jgi:hypothetical protein